MTALEKQEYTIFTVCNLAYLPKALVLAESVMKYQGIRLKIYLFDRKNELDTSVFDAELLWIEDQGVPQFLELAFQYDIIEFSTSLKPFLTLQLLDAYRKVIFLDPDTCLFDSVAPILEELDRHAIILTPHYTTPQPDFPGESDLPMMRFGSFNLGFYAVAGKGEGRPFLEWWSRRCIDLNFMESQFGLSTDQKWVMIAPCLFQDIFISFDRGYNVAAWNTFERELTKTEDGRYVVNGQYPLLFFHFSNFDPADPEYLKKRATNELGKPMPVIRELGVAYAAAQARYKEMVGPWPYSYDFMSNGDYISLTLRRAYTAVRSELPPGHDPFDAEGPVGRFAKKNHLVSRSTTRFVPMGVKDSKRHPFAFKVVYAMMRVALRIMGPNRFFNLSRLFVYLSMYWKNREMWKL